VGAWKIRGTALYGDDYYRGYSTALALPG
jgi:hypothetical protein